MIEYNGKVMIEVNGKLITEEEFNLLKKDTNHKLVETGEPQKFKLLEKMLG